MKTIVFALALLQTSLAAVIPYPESNVTLSKRSDLKLCENAQFNGFQSAGGSQGGDFCDTRWPGPNVVKGISTYSKGNDILGLELTWSNNEVSRWGSGFNTPKSGEIKLAPGELITSAWLAGNGKATRLGKIHITTASQEVSLGYSTASDITTVNVGSGLLVGVRGRCGLDIDSLALLFVRPRVKTVSIYNTRITDDELNAHKYSQPTGNASMVHYWNADPKYTAKYDFSYETSYTQERTAAQSTAVTFGASMGFSVEIGVPEVAKVSVTSEVSWGIEKITSTLLTSKETVAVKPGMSGLVPPNSGIDCSVLIWEGGGTFTYTSTVTISFDDGSTFSYDEQGQMTTKRFTSSDVSCRRATTQQTPAGYSNGQLTRI